MGKMLKFIVLILTVFAISSSTGAAYANEAYRAGEDIGRFFGKAIFFTIVFSIALMTIFIIILRAVFSIGRRVDQLDEIIKCLKNINTALTIQPQSNPEPKEVPSSEDRKTTEMPSKIPVKCPSCNKSFKVPDVYMGKNIKCPSCKKMISVTPKPILP